MKRSDLKAKDLAQMLAEKGREFVTFLLPAAVADPKNPDRLRIGSVAGEAGSSMQIDLGGRHAGTYIDWSKNDKSQDFIRLIMEVKGISIREAFIFACDWLGIPEDDGQPVKKPDGTKHKPTPRPPRIETRPPSDTWLRLQRDMRPCTMAELTQIAELRKIPAVAGLELASRAGQLWSAEVRDGSYLCPSWILTDGSRHNAQARKIDGSKFEFLGHKPCKAKTITGCEAGWPVGITEARDKPDIFLVEGGPDFLAAWHLIWLIEKISTTSPVAMFGISNSIHAAALPMFANKNVRIFPHNDPDLTGMNGAIRWRSQLLEAGARAVDFFDFRPEGNKDLNDLVTQQGVPELREVV